MGGGLQKDLVCSWSISSLECRGREREINNSFFFFFLDVEAHSLPIAPLTRATA